MRSEPHRISGEPVDAVHRSDEFLVLDEDAVVHAAHTYTRQVYVGYGNADEEELDATDCDIECCAIKLTRVVSMPVTCVACIGSRA